MVVALVPLACSDRDADEVDVGGAYSRVVQWFADRSDADPVPLVVFVEARGDGLVIDLAVQAEVVETNHEIADVRFVDDRAEALEDDGTAIRDEGILVALGPLVDVGDSVTIEVDQYDGPDPELTWSFDLRPAGDVWTLNGEPAAASS